MLKLQFSNTSNVWCENWVLYQKMFPTSMSLFFYASDIAKRRLYHFLLDTLFLIFHLDYLQCSNHCSLHNTEA